MRPTTPYLDDDDSSPTGSHAITTTSIARPGTQDAQTGSSIGLRNLAESHQVDDDVEEDIPLHEDQKEYSNHDDLGRGAAETPNPGMLSSIGRQLSFVDDEDAAHVAEPAITPSDKETKKPVSWKDLPHKGQLAILTMARLSEPLTQTSLQSYMFYQLKSFDPSLPDSTISAQAGMLQGSFTAAQFMTAILWGRAADADWAGRKKVLIIGLFGTCISCVGFGFSRSFFQAVLFRTLGGALNGNVGVMRTMISEIVKEKKFQSRAFLLLPMCFNIGVIIGPILGGLLADPVGSYPNLFGDNSSLGGQNGIWWMKHWPYALPNLLSACFLFTAAAGVIFGLEETLDTLRGKPDLGLRIGHYIAGLVRRIFGRQTHRYTAIGAEDTLNSSASNSSSRTTESYDLESNPQPLKPEVKAPPKRKLPFRRIWTRNVIFTLLMSAILALHVGTFQNLWFIFLSTPRFDPAHPIPPTHTSQSLPFSFTGGLGMPPRTVGFAMSVLGVIGISLQLFVYPTVNQKLGTLRSYRWFLCLFPFAYCLAPYLAIVHSSTSPPTQASGPLLWAALAGVVFLHGLARTFALPANTILVNNCSPHPSVLGTLHGIAQSVSSASRTVGPVAAGWLYGLGLRKGVVGGVWWGLGGVAIMGQVASGWAYEGSGHEILLEGEEEEAPERR